MQVGDVDKVVRDSTREHFSVHLGGRLYSATVTDGAYHAPDVMACDKPSEHTYNWRNATDKERHEVREFLFRTVEAKAVVDSTSEACFA